LLEYIQVLPVTVGGLPSSEGCSPPTLNQKRKGVLSMTVIELIGVLAALATFFGLGYTIGFNNAKKQPPA